MKWLACVSVQPFTRHADTAVEWVYLPQQQQQQQQ